MEIIELRLDDRATILAISRVRAFQLLKMKWIHFYLVSMR